MMSIVECGMMMFLIGSLRAGFQKVASEQGVRCNGILILFFHIHVK